MCTLLPSRNDKFICITVCDESQIVSKGKNCGCLNFREIFCKFSLQENNHLWPLWTSKSMTTLSLKIFIINCSHELLESVKLTDVLIEQSLGFVIAVKHQKAETHDVLICLHLIFI